MQMKSTQLFHFFFTDMFFPIENLNLFGIAIYEGKSEDNIAFIFFVLSNILYVSCSECVEKILFNALLDIYWIYILSFDIISYSPYRNPMKWRRKRFRYAAYRIE